MTATKLKPITAVFKTRLAAFTRRERAAILNVAVQNLLLMKGATDGLILAYDQETEICVLPAWIPEGEDLDAEEGSPLYAAHVEYQVSNGLDGCRGTSYDFYTLDEAMRFYRKSVAAGKLGG